jgi:hypothetical protein
MLVLSFRDMSIPRCSAVTTAAAYWLRPVTPALAWKPAPGSLLKLAAWNDVANYLRGKHVCFLVHGFNVDRDGGYTGLGALAQELEGGGALAGLPASPVDLHAAGVEAVVSVLWAGDWYLPINYPFLLPDIRATGRHFAEFIWSSASQMRRVSFVTHSMGARVVLETVQQAIAGAGPTVRMPVFDTAIFAAAAVSDDVLDDPDYALAADAFRTVTVVSSTGDTVLSGAFPAGNLVEQALWANDQGSDTALGRDGPQLKPDSRARGKTTWYPLTDHLHSDYLPSPLADAPPPGPAFPNGWSDKRLLVGRIAQAALDRTAAPIPPQPLP